MHIVQQLIKLVAALVMRGMNPMSCRLAIATSLATVGISVSSLTIRGHGQDPRDPVRQWLLQGQSDGDHLLRLKMQGDRALGEVKEIVAASTHPLSSEQESKLRLAIDGINARFTQDLAQYRALTEDLDINARNDQNRAMELLQPAMQQAHSGWYGKEFFAQIVNRTLDAEQKKVLTERRKSQRANRLQAISVSTVADLDERLALTKLQREKLLELMNRNDISKLPENYDFVVGYLKLLRIPPKDMDECLDVPQRATLEKILQSYRGYERAIP